MLFKKLSRELVQNTGQCPLIFRFRIKETLEGSIPVSQDESPRETRRKGKSEGKSLGKSPRNVKLDDVLQPHEQLLIFEGGLARSERPECFSFSNLDEDMRLLVPEGRKVPALGKSSVCGNMRGFSDKMEFGMIFRRPKKPVSEKEKSDDKSSKKKKKGKQKKTEDTEKLNYCHVAIVELTLGGLVHVQDFIIICSLK
ncbi:uncharacterized protein LOC143361692 [Halictus rubicundus]|uniref:uncharacterized protein LOC143361692 n=1 Tax=Halictus rubicundus TaxID=77578 RepID=UPI0040360082